MNKSIILKRMIGILIALIPFILVIILTVYDERFFKIKTAIVGYIFFAMGGLISGLNFYFSFLRYGVYFVLGKTKQYQFVSGIPLLGFLTVVGLLLIPKSFVFSSLAFIFLIMDTGGIQWFIVCAWKDKSFWASE